MAKAETVCNALKIDPLPMLQDAKEAINEGLASQYEARISQSMRLKFTARLALMAESASEFRREAYCKADKVVIHGLFALVVSNAKSVVTEHETVKDNLPEAAERPMERSKSGL